MTEGPGPEVTALDRAAADRLADTLAALTRAAYRGSDPLPGLPVPDGAFETAADVRAALASGATVWLAFLTPGRPVGALRVLPRPDGAWRIARVSVLPAARGAGIARRLIAAVEVAALRAGVPVLRLDAVVERCLPSLYARLGFAPVRHWASGDKPLTEVTMERLPGAAPLPRPRAWQSPGRLPRLHWLLTADGLLASTTPHRAGKLAGIDVWHGAGDLRTLLVSRGGRPTRAGVLFPGRRADTAVHLMPRTADPRLQAWCRLPPGTELPWPNNHVPTQAGRST
ncbi:hypothetical protein SRB5_29920 [Streptomyces sp. RB5]|uniref:N-acetyltransferase domain-containing protein n=1 Tax=Streptomyces smaragdinus TaxID=2585196 RepID=A0A7K0CHR5_9ACTN|nr:GNAT family N-acetyltransferase [Streptomyces smaragdinus]MQY12853.1 hypothetical protein [Streptomyces smaragdinus]